jgi:hypothetical protein
LGHFRDAQAIVRGRGVACAPCSSPQRSTSRQSRCRRSRALKVSRAREAHGLPNQRRVRSWLLAPRKARERRCRLRSLAERVSRSGASPRAPGANVGRLRYTSQRPSSRERHTRCLDFLLDRRSGGSEDPQRETPKRVRLRSAAGRLLQRAATDFLTNSEWHNILVQLPLQHKPQGRKVSGIGRMRSVPNDHEATRFRRRRRWLEFAEKCVRGANNAGGRSKNVCGEAGPERPSRQLTEAPKENNTWCAKW